MPIKVRQIPFSRLKIDRSFVRENGRSPEALAILRASLEQQSAD
ncbi:hypothetical protein [Mesorhizobium sp.]|nr:hypothetical protein [Mesorhizobium sp.]